jgi:5-methylcytosine-specific restriction protein A
MALGEITKAAVLQAIEEYDTLGRETFLDKYSFQDAKRYWLVRDGKRYPSKAIAGVAHKYVAGQQLLGSNSFTGGEGTVVKKLRELGFTIESVSRNPDWTRDERILALDLYFTNPASPPRQDSAAVQELSALLNKMHRISGTSATETLRNPNGVYLKMMNFRAIDPAFKLQGKAGMPRGASMDDEVFADYVDRRPELAADAATIREAIKNADEDEIAALPEAEPYEGEEGGVIVRLHKRY